MSVQVFNQNSTVPFVRFPFPGIVKSNQVLLQDAGRVDPLVQFTLMSQVTATGKWVPFTDETATNGSAIPRGIYIGDDITAAAIAAGDVVDIVVLTGYAIFDKNQLVIENAKTLSTVINATGGADNITVLTVEDYLSMFGLIAEDTIDISR